MTEATYEVGYELGKHWAVRDAKPGQLHRVKEIGDGWNWVKSTDEPATEITRIIDPDQSGFMEIDDTPPASFIAGLIDGAQSIDDAD
ncbi:MAG: hypothetical protein ACE5OQ_16480 [Woeseia sp.]